MFCITRLRWNCMLLYIWPARTTGASPAGMLSCELHNKSPWTYSAAYTPHHPDLRWVCDLLHTQRLLALGK